MKGFSLNIGDCRPIEAECWALMKELNMAMECGARRVAIETDSVHASDFINRKSVPVAPVRNIMELCHTKMRHFDEVIVTHCYRE